MKGTYALLIRLPERTTVKIGALGEITFNDGWYVYSGSAFGPGGFSRIDRHKELANGNKNTRHWHIDYFLGDTEAIITTVFRTPEKDIECNVAQGLPGTRVAEFGASDCNCASHMIHHTKREKLASVLRKAHETVQKEANVNQR